MDSENFEQNKENLRAELEAELLEKSGEILASLIRAIMADPRTITASILGVDVSEIIKRTISEKLDEYTKEE